MSTLDADSPIKTHRLIMATNPEGKNLGGRPEVYFSRDQEAMAYGLVLQGVSYEKIANALDVHVDTLKKHLGETLADAKAQCIARVTGSLYKAALRADDVPHGVAAAKFWLGSQAGWIEKHAQEISGPAGKAIEHEHRVRWCDSDGSGLPEETPIPSPPE